MPRKPKKAKENNTIEEKNNVHTNNNLEAALALLIQNQAQNNEILNNIAKTMEIMSKNIEKQNTFVSEDEARRNLEEARAKKPLPKKNMWYIVKKEGIDRDGSVVRSMPISGVMFKSEEEIKKF
jgi:hypothetical protein